MKNLLFSAAALAAVVLTACNGDNQDYPTIDPEYAILDFERAPSDAYAVDIAGSNLYSGVGWTPTPAYAGARYTTYTDAHSGITIGLNVDVSSPTDTWPHTDKPEFSSGGIAPSRLNDMTTKGFANQCSVFDAKVGHAGSKSFGIVFAPEFSNGTAKLSFADGVEHVAAMMWVTNATYTALEYDTEKLTSGKVWLKMTVTGYNKAGVKTSSAEKYLVDYRENIVNKGMLKEWTPLDLTGLGKVNRLEILMSSNDSMFPNYACIDDVTFLL